MSTNTKMSETDEKLKQMIKRRNLSKGAIKNYNTVFNDLYNLFDVTPSDIVRIGKREQKPYVDKETGGYDILDLEDRTVTKYQFEYYEYLENKKLSNKTIKQKLNIFRALLGEYDITKPKPINIVIKTDRIRDEDIPNWREVEKGMSFCKGIRDKAIISYIATTGLRSSDVRSLSIQDLVNACSIYFEENEEKTIENLLNKNPEDIVPCWELMPKKTDKKSQLCVTFNTPECSEYIWQYLNERIAIDIKNGGGGVLNPNEPLFATSKKKPLTSTAIEQMFQRVNKKLGGKKDKNGKYGRFRAHSLRKLFSSTCRQKLPYAVINSDKTSEIDIVSIFTGHVPPNESNSRVYEAIESDSHDSYLRKTYQGLMKYLSIKEIEVKDFKTEQYKEIEEKHKAFKEHVENQNVAMQRDFDEQKEKYEKRINHLENVNKELSSELETVKRQVLQMANQNNILVIQDYIKDNELVNHCNLGNKVLELYISDIEDNPTKLVTYQYIEELINRAFDDLPEKDKKEYYEEFLIK